MKASEVSAEQIAGKLRLDVYSAGEMLELKEIALAYIQSYTGLTAEKIDEKPEFVLALYVLCQDMYDNRAMYVDKTAVNKTVQTILDMHSVNLIPKDATT